MAMLAEPRRRQKLSSDPRNKSWSDDSTKFGQRLMEKMGWSKGRGLGAKEDGNLEHVKVSLKNNNLGVGCSARHEDNWIAHQDDFNDILASLGQSHTKSSLPTDDAEQESRSLEERSKKSRKRVHYKKFTKGKDLTTYGKDGMNSILGKRLAHSAPVTPQSQSAENSDEEKDDASPEDTSHGVVTVKSSCSVSEYFAKKMADLKKSRRRVESESHSDGEVEATRSGFGFYPMEVKGQEEEEEEGRMGFGFRPQQEKSASDVSKMGMTFVSGQASSSSDALERTTKSNDKSNESNERDKNDEEEVEAVSQSRDGKRKKRRKRKKDRGGNVHVEDDVDRVNEERRDVRIEVNDNDDEDEGIELERKKKKNKKKKKLVDELVESKSSDSASQQDDVVVSVVEKKKKKKTKKSKKDKSRHEEDRATCSNDSDEMGRSAVDDLETCSGAKKRKAAASLEGEVEEENRDEGETNSCKKKRKKDKLDKDQPSGHIEEKKCPSLKKKRKKNRKQGDV